MAQRELKIKITPEMSASFKKLLNMLGKTQTLNIRTNGDITYTKDIDDL